MSYVVNRIIQTFESLLHNIYIPKINFYDIIEILIIIFMFYFIAKAVKNTRTWVLAKGALLLAVFYFLSYLFSFNVITRIFESAMLIFAVGIVIIFSPEIKKFLEKIGTQNFNKSKKVLFNINNETHKISDKTIDEIVAACEQMSKSKTGALIVYENTIPLNEYIDTGIEIESTISRQLLINMFEPNTPLHDGAVIIKENIIKAATCYLPLSDDTKISKRHGTRHRAALGISESTDAITIVVSEETGRISVTRNGKISTVQSKDLKEILTSFREETVVIEKKKISEILKNNIGLKIVSVLFGIILWLTIMNVANPVISNTLTAIPITVENESAITELDKTYTINSSKYVDVIITGHRSDIEKVKKEDIKISANLSKLSEINTVKLTAKSNIPDIDVEIKDDIMSISIENCVDKIFDITIEKKGTEDVSCFVYDVNTEKDGFKINGPESIIKIIDKVVFVADVSNCTGDKEIKISPIIYDKNGNIISKSKLILEEESLPFNILTMQTKEINLNITPDCNEYIKQYINTFSAVPTTIRVAANNRTLNSLTNLDVVIPIELTDENLLSDTYTTKVDISKYVPEGIYVPYNQRNIDIVLGFASEITREITVDFTDIEIRNNKENFKISTAEKEFVISIFGDKNTVLGITVEDIKPFIDLENSKLGNNVVYIECDENEDFSIINHKKITIITSK